MPHTQMEHRVHVYNVAAAETVCGLTNPEVTASNDPDLITCTYCKSIIARDVIQRATETIHYARPDGGGDAVCSVKGRMITLFWDDVTCTFCKAHQPKEPGMPRGPFTHGEFFTRPAAQIHISFPAMCEECGALVANAPTHVEWHNAVANL